MNRWHHALDSKKIRKWTNEEECKLKDAFLKKHTGEDWFRVEHEDSAG
jgi:hypothetical protein